MREAKALPVGSQARGFLHAAPSELVSQWQQGTSEEGSWVEEPLQKS